MQDTFSQGESALTRANLSEARPGDKNRRGSQIPRPGIRREIFELRTRTCQRSAVIWLETPLGRRSGIHPQRSYALSAKTSVPANSPSTQSPPAGVTESSLNVEPG